jgi:hypothetical protein
MVNFLPPAKIIKGMNTDNLFSKQDGTELLDTFVEVVAHGLEQNIVVFILED